MKKLFASLFISFAYFSAQAQIVFEKGYIITENNEKVECLIKNEDWRYTPSEFEYKLSDSSAVQVGTLASIKEFGINDVYKRFAVQMDRASDEMELLDQNRNPIMKEEILFLKTLIMGKASLYQYQDVNTNKFFFSMDSVNIPEILVYKRYKSADGDLLKNKSYLQQLSNNLICADAPQNNKVEISYDKNSMVRFFIEYNKCSNAAFTEYGKRPKQDRFNLSLRAGVDFSTLYMTQRSQTTSLYKFGHFGNATIFRPGIEAEFILPYNKGVWAFIIEASLRKFSLTKEIDSWPATIDYNSREISFGLRRRFFYKNSSRLFVNGAYLFDFFNYPSNLNLGMPDIINEVFDLNTRGSLNLGTGYNFRNRLSVEIKYGIPKKIFPGISKWDSKYQNIALIIGYNIF